MAVPQGQKPVVISGEQFRREILGFSRDKFYRLVKSGRLTHLLAVNLSTSRRKFYVRDLAEKWATETVSNQFERTRVFGRKRL